MSPALGAAEAAEVTAAVRAATARRSLPDAETVNRV
jgi:hypothetical protein